MWRDDSGLAYCCIDMGRKSLASFAMEPSLQTASPGPVPYHPRYEKVEAAEAESERELIEKVVRIQPKIQAESHGILRGEIRVASDLPPHLAQGMFACGGTYPVVMRFSTYENASTPRGLAVKVIGVSGARLPGSEDDITQDFVMVNSPVLPPEERQVETHILGETFFSTTPYLYGRYMAKFSIVPVSAELRALQKVPLHLEGTPHGLRDATLAFFQQHGADWELHVQLCIDAELMPIENAQVIWPESLCAWLPVARIVAPPQRAWSEARAKAIEESFSFDPWHGLAAHRPLGSINRLRKRAYEASRAFRGSRTGWPIEEPRDLSRFPD